METKEKTEKEENGPLNLYKKTILWTKLAEAMQEMKDQHKITAGLEQKIMAKFDDVICQELANCSKSKNTIKGTVTSFRNCDDIWIFYCKDVTVNIENKKETLSIPKLKIIALDEKLKQKNKENDKYEYNVVGES